MQDRQLGDHSIEKHLNAFCAVVLDLKMATSNHNLHVLVLSHLTLLFPGLSAVWFLITCSVQKWRGEKAWSFYHVNDFSVYLGRH